MSYKTDKRANLRIRKLEQRISKLRRKLMKHGGGVLQRAKVWTDLLNDSPIEEEIEKLETKIRNLTRQSTIVAAEKLKKPKRNLFGLGKGTPREEIEKRRHREVGKLLQEGKLREARRVRRQSTRRFARKHGLKVEGALRGAGRRAKERARSKAHGIVERIFGSKNPVPALLTSLGSTLAEGAGFAAGEMGVTQLAKKKKKAHHMKTKHHARKRGKKNPGSREYGDYLNNQLTLQHRDYTLSPKQRIKILQKVRSYERKAGVPRLERFDVRRMAKNPGRRMKKTRSLYAIGVGRLHVASASTKREASAKAQFLRDGGARKVRIKLIPERWR